LHFFRALNSTLLAEGQFLALHTRPEKKIEKFEGILPIKVFELSGKDSVFLAARVFEFIFVVANFCDEDLLKFRSTCSEIPDLLFEFVNHLRYYPGKVTELFRKCS